MTYEGNYPRCYDYIGPRKSSGMKGPEHKRQVTLSSLFIGAMVVLCGVSAFCNTGGSVR